MPSSWCIAGTTLIGGALFIFITMGIPIIVYYEVVKPRDPTFTLDYASVTGFNFSSDGHLTAFFDVVIRASNPNHKLKLKYWGVRVSILKDKQNLAVDAVPDFTQRKRNVTMIRAEPVALNVTLKKGPAFDFELERGIGYIDFDVSLTASLNAAYLLVNCQHAVVNLNAPSVIAADSSSVNDNNINGRPNFRSIGCSVYIYSDN